MRWFNRVLILLLATLTACGQSPVSNTATPEPTLPPTPMVIATSVLDNASSQNDAIPPAAAQQPGTIRVVHAAAETPSINLIAGIQAIVTNLNYGSATEPTPLSAGEHTVEIVASGSRPSDPSLLETSFTLEGGASLLLVVARQNDQLTLLSFPESVEPLNPGESIITVVNALAPASDFQIMQVQPDSRTLTPAIPFGQTETTEILPSGATQLALQAGDTRQTYDLVLEEGRHYTLVVSGSPENITVGSYSSQALGRARVRAVHASQAIGPIDVYVGENLIAQQAEFARPLSRQNLVSGQHVVSVYAAGNDPVSAEPLITQTIELLPAGNISLVLLGETNNPTLMVYEENLSPTPPGKARISFLNTLSDVPLVHLETSGGPFEDIPDMPFGQPPPSTLLGASAHNFYLTQPDNTLENQTVETIQDVQLEAGTYYLFLITGRDDSQPFTLSEDVGIDESLSPNPDEVVEPINSDPAQVRFINAVADQPVLDFQVNGLSTTNIAYAASSQHTAVTQPNAAIEVSLSSSGELLQSLEEALEGGERYTVIAYGTDQRDVRLMLLPDSGLIFDGRSPYLRLINLSPNSDSSLGLGYAPQSATPEPDATFQPFEDIRRSIPGGIQQLVGNIMGGMVSPVILMPARTFELQILDTATNQLANILPGVNLEAGRHYDVVAYEEQDTTRVQAFVVQYPADSD